MMLATIGFQMLLVEIVSPRARVHTPRRSQQIVEKIIINIRIHLKILIIRLPALLKLLMHTFMRSYHVMKALACNSSLIIPVRALRQ